MMDNKLQKQLLAKLRQPLHISYIANYILKEDMLKTKKIINFLIEQDVIEESKYAKEYYVIKNK
jgi:hypothetical protein